MHNIALAPTTLPNSPPLEYIDAAVQAGYCTCFAHEDIARLITPSHAWHGTYTVGAGLVPAQGDHKERPYVDVPGFCFSSPRGNR